MPLIDGMNAEQCRVIQYKPGPLAVVAVAGCGKTRALVHRVAQLIADGAEPNRVLAVTFSTKAAREMTNRLARLGCTDARVGTFHSVAYQIVRSDLTEYRSWEVDDRDRYRLAVKDAVSYKYMSWGAADVSYLLSFIALCKAAGALPSLDDQKTLSIATELFCRKRLPARAPKLCIEAYIQAEIIRRERQLLTFDDMLLEAWSLFCRDDAARQSWAARWDHVLQDECQDENFVQHELASQLAREHRSYTIVGDPAQSIYKFRGADPTAMQRFRDEWGAHVESMGRNYRCASKIVDVANKILQAMPAHTHLGVEMIAERQEPGEVRVVIYENFDAEGEGVTERILESFEDGRQWRDHVVLYRTNAQSRGVEEALLGARVPYVVLGGTNFYERREVSALLAYLRVAAGIGTFDDVKRSINTPFRFLGKAFIDGLYDRVGGTEGPALLDEVRAYVEDGQARLQSRQKGSALSWCDSVRKLARRIELAEHHPTTTRDSAEEQWARPSALLENLVTELKYAEWLTRDEGSESPENNRVSNVRELIRAAGRFPTAKELLAYIDDTLKRAAQAKRELRSSDVVTLCSIHRSKGLEWPVVFVLGVNEKILPHAMSEDIEEERRLFYVATTRAADVLELSVVSQAAVSNRILMLEPSRFISEAGLTVETPITTTQVSETP